MENTIVKTDGNAPVVLNFFDPQQFDTMQRVCRMFANSDLVPDMYKTSTSNPIEKAMANCMIAIDMASRIGASPLMIMQNMVVIYGRPAWSSKFLVATVNTCGRFNPLQYKFTNLGKLGKVEYTEYEWKQQNDGKNKKVAVTKNFDGSNIDNIQCIAFTTSKKTDSLLESSPITIELAIQEGWYTKAGSKWKTMTQQMLMYRAASFWTSAYAPDVSMGMKTVEEIQDFIDIEHEDVTEKVTKDIKENANKEEISFEKPKVTPEPIKPTNGQVKPEPQLGF